MSALAAADRYRLWWVDPANLLIFLTLPVFFASARFGGPLISQQFESFDFLTDGMIYLGVLAICLLAVGAKLGAGLVARSNSGNICFHPYRYDQFLVLVLVISILSYVLLLGALLLNPTLMLSVVQGERGATFWARAYLNPFLGVTSLTNVAPVFFCMCAVRFVTRGAFFPSYWIGYLALLLMSLILVHGFIGSGRLVLLENGIAFLLPLFSFAERLKRFGLVVPIVGVVAVVIIFAAGEYMRSWAYYQNSYDSFGQYVWIRLLAYLALASNTGAGMVSTLPPVGYPLITAAWVPRLFGAGSSAYSRQFLDEFGNVEFNNPGGIFAPIVDFGTVGGIVYLFAWGLVLGTLYGVYRRRHPVGLLAYPLFYIGLADLTQIWYWGQPPFIPQLIFAGAAIVLTVRRQVRAGAQSHA